jgi:HK97 family phage major capsid protein
MIHGIYGRKYATEEELAARVAELDAKYAGAPMPDAARDEWNALNETLDELRKRRERVLELARSKPRNMEAAVHYSSHAGSTDPRGANSLRSAALTANERTVRMPDSAREHMARQLEQDDDPEARLARFVIETSTPAYFGAFRKWMNDPVSGGHEWTPQEREAVHRVKSLARSMNLTLGQGGALVPYELDPNVIISSAGYVDPIRQIARVETTAFNTKKFVTSTGVTSHWYAEEAEVSDDSAALLQPSIDCKKAMAFTPVSFELFEDSDIAQQIGRVFADSKAAEEARVFAVGNGTTEPKGVITAISAVGGSVITTGSNVLATADLYNNQAALPARWRPNARWMMNLSIINGYRQLPQATGLNYSIVNDDGPLPTALGWEIRENSNMDGTLTGAAADYLVLSGSFQQYAVVDRVGSTLEVVQNLVGANRRPTGQRGFLLHWRSGADALVPDAFRLSNFNT